MPKRRGEASKFRGTPLGVWITAFSLVAVAGTSAYAAGFSLDDDSAVLIATDGVIYSIDLTDAGLTAGASLSGDALGDVVAVEGIPSSDTVFALDADTDPSLASVSTVSGASTHIKDDYTNQEVPDGIVRLDDGTTYLAHLPAGEATWHISALDLATGEPSNSQEFDLSGVNKRVYALAAVDSTVYAFLSGEEDAVYSVDPATGTLTAVSAASGALTGENVFGADTTADGTVYLLGVDGSDNGTLYTTDLAGTTTQVGTISLGTGVTAGNLAIATLLDSERVEEDSGDSGDSGDSSESDSDSDDEDTPAPAAVPPPAPAPVPAPTPAPAPEPQEDPVQEEPAAPVTAEPEPLPEPEPVLEPEPVAQEDPALFPLPWVVGVLALLVVVVFALFFWFVTRRERQLRANR